MRQRTAQPSDYTPEDIDRLRQMWFAGYSGSQIGRELGRSKNSVVGRAHRMGLPSRPSPLHAASEPRPSRPKPPPLEIEKRGPGAGAIRQTLPAAPPAPEPAPKAAWRHPDGCQWHVRREGIRHVFCCAPIGPRAGAYCAVHHALAYASAAASVPSHATDDARARL